MPNSSGTVSGLWPSSEQEQWGELVGDQHEGGGPFNDMESESSHGVQSRDYWSFAIAYHA